MRRNKQEEIEIQETPRTKGIERMIETKAMTERIEMMEKVEVIEGDVYEEIYQFGDPNL